MLGCVNWKILCFKRLAKFNILCLQEAYIFKNEVIRSINNFSTTPHCRNISANNRYFGGMIIYVRNSIKNGIKIGKKCDKDTLEVILKKQFFGLPQDRIILYTYASPINSCYTKSRSVHILDKLETDYLSADKKYIVMGDLNGRTRMEEDFVRDDLDKHSPINEAYYQKDTPLHRLRSNRDPHPVDEQGRKIIDLCKTSALRILNGRTYGDIQGNFTRYPSILHENPSTIDYALCSNDLISDIHSFTVLTFTSLSDHCCLALNIKVKTAPIMRTLPETKNDSDIFSPSLKHKYSYDKQKKNLYEQNLSNNKNIDLLYSTLNNGDISAEVIDRCVADLNPLRPSHF